MTLPSPRGCLVLLFIAVISATPVVDDPLLRTARESHSERLMSAITQTTKNMAQDATSLSVPISVDWNATMDADIGGLDMLGREAKSALGDLFKGLVEQEASFLRDMLDQAFRGGAPIEVAHARSMVRNCGKYATALKEAGTKVTHAMQEGMVEAGSGFGFGFQVYCGCKLLMMTGGGFGSGMTASKIAGVAGGLGGGGGVQLYGVDQKVFPAMNVGGGGGGDLNGCAGTTDFGQVFPFDTMHEARDALMAPQVKSCPKGELTIVGGGGGGIGFTVSHSNHSVSAYGGGLDLRFSNADAAANNARCGGKLIEKVSTQTSGGYAAIDTATAKCRKQCAGAVKDGLAVFWKCTCPCTQEAFQALNLPFASKMKCM